MTEAQLVRIEIDPGSPRFAVCALVTVRVMISSGPVAVSESLQSFAVSPGLLGEPAGWRNIEDGTRPVEELARALTGWAWAWERRQRAERRTLKAAPS